MIYLCAGVYAEGPSDDALLLPLLDQLIPALAADVLREVPITVLDPKHALREIVARSGGVRLDPWLLYEFFGSNINPAALRRLPAFRRFEDEMRVAIARAARS